MKTLLIIPYFGKKPSWIGYFITSCRHNQAFDFLIVTNFDLKPPNTKNIKHIEMTLDEFNHLAGTRLNISLNITNPYKICDLKPAFGQIFNKHIKGYDFWGYCDLDLIFGRISGFIKETHLQHYDVVTTKKDYMSGHFSLFRNIPELTTLYQKVYHINKRLKDNGKYYAIDERTNFIGHEITQMTNLKIKIPVSFIKKVRNSICYRLLKNLPLRFDFSRVVSNEEKKGTIKIMRMTHVRSDMFFAKKNIPNWEVYWENGSLFNITENREIMYFHFIRMKNDKTFVPCTDSPENSFRITKEGLCHAPMNR